MRIALVAPLKSQKCEFLGKARALLFPIDWPEPFGLVMIEAMSAGTPVIAWRNGSVPEVVTEGVSGRMVELDRVGGGGCATDRLHGPAQGSRRI